MMKMIAVVIEEQDVDRRGVLRMITENIEIYSYDSI